MNFLDTARQVGSWCWRESRAFEIVGGWVASVEDPEAKVQLFSHARRKGGHAVALAELLPAIAGSRPSDFLVPTPSDAALVDALGLPTRGEDRLAALYEAFAPAAVSGFRAFLEGSRPVGSMPAIRVVAAVLADEEQDARVGSALLGRIRREPGHGRI